MKVRRSLAVAVAGAALFGTTMAGTLPAQATTATKGHVVATGDVSKTKSLATVVAPYAKSWNNNWHDYNIVSHAVFAVLKAKPTSSVAVLADGKVALTAFLPNDRAFQILVEKLTGKMTYSEQSTYKAVLTLGVPTIEAVLLYHVVPGATITSAQALKANGAHLKTAQGGTFRVKVTSAPSIELVDADPYMTNAKVVLSQVDINKGNKQIAHGIDRVMLPLPLKPKKWL